MSTVTGLKQNEITFTNRSKKSSVFIFLLFHPVLLVSAKHWPFLALITPDTLLILRSDF